MAWKLYPYQCERGWSVLNDDYAQILGGDTQLALLRIYPKGLYEFWVRGPLGNWHEEFYEPKFDKALLLVEEKLAELGLAQMTKH